MELHQALREAVREQGWTVTKLAAEFDVTEEAARRWLRGSAKPLGRTLLRLQRELPGFSDRLLNGEARRG